PVYASCLTDQTLLHKKLHPYRRPLHRDSDRHRVGQSIRRPGQVYWCHGETPGNKNENFHMWLDAWYSFRIKALASIMVLAISLIVILDKSYSPSMAALFITWSDDFLHRLKFFLHFCIRTEKDMVSLERMLEFSAKPQEVSKKPLLRLAILR
ncbi:multidrug resistance-associated ABC transporter protein, partial [Elysia marginata]